MSVRRFSNLGYRLLPLGAVLFLSGCFPWPHRGTVVDRISGVLMKDGQAVSGADVLLGGRTCDHAESIATTATDGRFRYPGQRHWQMFFVPLVEPIAISQWTLCVRIDGETTLGLHGVSRWLDFQEVEIKCDLARPPSERGLNFSGVCSYDRSNKPSGR